jgi:8-oxo-dGTP diphosphatase
MSSHDTTIADSRSNGVVAVICKDRQFLVIKRGTDVIAPGKICFPGGETQAGESAEDAVLRELREELGVEGEVVDLIWKSVTPWEVSLSWWRVELKQDSSWQPNSREVQWVGWLGSRELMDSPNLLESNRHFLEAIERGEILSPVDG